MADKGTVSRLGPAPQWSIWSIWTPTACLHPARVLSQKRKEKAGQQGRCLPRTGAVVEDGLPSPGAVPGDFPGGERGHPRGMVRPGAEVTRGGRGEGEADQVAGPTCCLRARLENSFIWSANSDAFKFFQGCHEDLNS